MGMGVVIRNHEGEFRVAKSSFINGRSDPTVAEAMAVVHAIGFCKEMGIQSLSLEEDAKNVVSALISREKNWSRKGHIVADAK
jgi:ribonuclease HI